MEKKIISLESYVERCQSREHLSSISSWKKIQFVGSNNGRCTFFFFSSAIVKLVEDVLDKRKNSTPSGDFRSSVDGVKICYLFFFLFAVFYLLNYNTLVFS